MSRSRLGLGTVRLGSRSRPKRSRRLVSGLGPFRLVETFCADARRAFSSPILSLLTSMAYLHRVSELQSASEFLAMN